MPLLLAAAILTLTAVVALWLPLTSQLGFEFSMLIGAVSVLLFGVIGIAERRERTFIQLLRDWLPLLGLPLLVIALNGLRLGGCGVFSGLGFFMLLPVVSVVLTAAVVRCCRVNVVNDRRRYLLFFGVVAASVLFTVGRLIYSGSVFAFNPFFGYFPGPIYDAALAIDSRLILYRLFTLLLAGWFLTYRRGTVFLVLSALIFGVFLFQGRLGFYTTRGTLHRALSATLQGRGFEVHYDPNLSRDEFRPEVFLSDVQYWYDDLVRNLEVHAAPVRLYVYKDAASKKRLMGAGNTLIGNPLRRELHLLPLAFPDTTLKHELTHVLAADFGLPLLGLGRSAGLMEGLAVALEGRQDDYPLDLWAKALLQQTTPADPAVVMRGFGFFKYAAQKSYLLSGSFVDFLLKQYGIAKFKQVYRSGDFIAVYGQALPQLLEQWRGHLAGLALSAEVEKAMFPTLKRPGLLDERCPHESAVQRQAGFAALRAGESATAQRCFLTSYRLSGGSGVDLYGLLATLYRQRDESKPLTTYALTSILRQRREYLNPAWGILGGLMLRQHEPLVALWAFSEASKLEFVPEQQLMARLAATGLVGHAASFSLATPSERSELMQQWLSEGQSLPELRILQAVDVIRRAVSTEVQLQSAVAALQEVSTRGCDPRWERLRRLQLGEYYFRHGQYDLAHRQFDRIAHDSTAKLWLERLVATGSA